MTESKRRKKNADRMRASRKKMLADDPAAFRAAQKKNAARMRASRKKTRPWLRQRKKCLERQLQEVIAALAASNSGKG